VSARLAVSPEAEELVDVFGAELVAAGLTAWPSTMGGARAFCARYTSPERFSAACVEDQLRLPAHLRQFACWLMVTGRMKVSAEYLARADLRLGTVAAHYHVELHARLAATAALLGSDHCWVAAQWNALAQLGALHGVAPAEVTAEQLDTGGTALLAAFARPGHPRPVTGRAAPLSGCGRPCSTPGRPTPRRGSTSRTPVWSEGPSGRR